MASSITTGNKNTMRTKKLPACIDPGILRTNFADGDPTSPNLQPAWLFSASICIHYIDFLHNSRYCWYPNWPNFHHHQSTWLSLFSSFAISFQISPTNIQPDQASISPPVHQGVNSTSNNASDLVIGQVFSPANKSSSDAGFWKLAASFLFWSFIEGGHLINNQGFITLGVTF